MSQRWPIHAEADPTILSESIQFPTSKRTMRNRIFKVALTECMATWDTEDPQKSGIPTQKLINLYGKWGVGGYGMIITGNYFVDPKHVDYPSSPLFDKNLDTKERRDAFKNTSDALKRDGALAVVQLKHAGKITATSVNEHPFTPSGVKNSSLLNKNLVFGDPIPLTNEQIKTEVVEKFAYAAKFCYETGFDGVEIHAAYGALLSDFLTPNTNKRTDEYGGSVENRARVIKEIYEAIRQEIPPETGFVVGIKVNTHEFQNDEFSHDDVLKFCQEFDKYGFDYIELTGGNNESMVINYAKIKESTRLREAYFYEQSKNIKPNIKNAKIFMTGGLRTVAGMVNVINDEVGDAVGLGRPAVAELDVPKKLLSGKFQSVAYNHLEESWPLYGASTVKNMQEAAETTLEEALAKGDVNYGVTNFSDKIQADEFKAGLEKGA